MDPTGTVGAKQKSDIEIAMGGGLGFMERLKALSDAADRMEAAAAKVRLGKNVEDTLAEAARKLADAEAQQKKVTGLRFDAEAQAKEVIATANRRAAEILKAANEAKAKVEAEAAAVRDNANAHAAQVNTSLEAAKSDHNKRAVMLREVQDRAKDAEARALAAEEKANQRAYMAHERANDLQAKLLRLQAAIDSVK